jgi:rhodanese-related sulfurtransferase
MKQMLPKEAHALLTQQADALLIDVRMEVEFQYVGHPPNAVNLPWYDFPNYKPDVPAFLAAVEALAKDKTRPIVLLCRTGQRTVDADIALEKAGFSNVINVLDGFEGDLDDDQHRNTETGWRYCGLPWVQS